MRAFKRITLKVLSVIDPSGDLFFLVNRAINRISIPQDSMSGEEISRVLQDLCTNKIVLEFGCGGSTLLFSKYAERVTSIESDSYFANRIKEFLIQSNLSHKVDIYLARIGPTKSYGQPIKAFGLLYANRYRNYYSGVFNKSSGAK